MKVERTDSIFIQIASYRDPELRPTLQNLLDTASGKFNYSICIAWQHSSKDLWDTLEDYKHDSRFKILDIDYRESKGACWARNLIQQHYSGETYTLQLDSHHRFVQDWDIELVTMLKELQSNSYAKPLITTYLPSYFPDKDPQSRTQAVWQMDFNRFTPEGYIFTMPSTVQNWRQLTKPIPARYYSAHFAFTLGQFCNEVQHDPYMYFHGEEPSIAARAYTWGYDLFHPHKIVAWHEYTREGKRKHWDDFRTWSKLDQESHKRYRILHGMEQQYTRVAAKELLGPYYFGPIRSLREYEEYSGVRFSDRKVQQYTLDRNQPPNPQYSSVEELEANLVSVFKHCLDIHRTHFKCNDYEYWVISFEKLDGTVLARLDADADEITKLQREKGDWIKIWREYRGARPDKWVVWPYSKSKGYVERLETLLK
jgi:hypothetical protein